MTLNAFCEYNEIMFQERNLPTKIKGFSYHDDEGRFIVVLNTKLGILKNKDTTKHELLHILRDDHYNPGFMEY